MSNSMLPSASQMLPLVRLAGPTCQAAAATSMQAGTHHLLCLPCVTSCVYVCLCALCSAALMCSMQDKSGALHGACSVH